MTVSSGQSLSQSRPSDLLATEPGTFAEWLHRARPTPVSPEEKTRILNSLPRDGEVTELNTTGLMKLAGVRRVLRRADRDSVFVIKVIDVPQAAVGLHGRTVVLISEAALALLSTEELQALAAHEIGHEYVWADYASAVRLADRNRFKELELICDTIAIVTLHGLGLEWSRLTAGLEKISRFNRDHFGTAVNEGNYPTLAERRDFARKVGNWLRQDAPVTSRAAGFTTPAERD